MKQVRFRVWNGSQMEHKIMAGFLGAFYVQGIDEKDTACMSPFNTKYQDDTFLMQFTGLLDCNGKEIYEGDFLKCLNPKSLMYSADELCSHFLVRWDERKTGFNCFPQTTLTKEDYKTALEHYGGTITWPDENVLLNHWHYEVIGNLFENQELLVPKF